MNTNTLPGKMYIVVTDYMNPDTGEDVSDKIQEIIDSNPNRTIFFPDGTYILGKPVCTSANPADSVSLVLANYAVIKASDDWNSDEALIRIGGKNPTNDHISIGSNYGIEGGIIDGNWIANGISVDSGRESFIRNLSIKRTKIGIHIKRGANNGSSDADLMGINIIGNNAPDSVGILSEGYDNTFTNFRISNIMTGVIIKSGGNIFRNIHPLYKFSTCPERYTESCAFLEEEGGNIYDYCYSDQFSTGFRSLKGRKSIYTNCLCFWYSPKAQVHTAFECEGKFDSPVCNLRVSFIGDETEHYVLKEGEPGGVGIFDNLIVNGVTPSDDIYTKYLKGYINYD